MLQYGPGKGGAMICSWPDMRLVLSQVAAAVKELEGRLVKVFEAMPRDLQQLVLSSPQRAALLHRLNAHSKVPLSVHVYRLCCTAHLYGSCHLVE